MQEQGYPTEISNTPHPWPSIRFFLHSATFFRLHARKLLALTSILSLPILTLIFSGKDRDILMGVQQPADTQAHAIAVWISEFGEFHYSTLAISGIFWAIYFVGRGERFRRTWMALLVAGILGGVLVNVLRPTLARARPHTENGGQFTYLSMNSRYHGFPSGHVASTTATLSALAFLHPPLAIPAWAGSLAVGWSRMQVNRHFLSDVLAGLLLGGICGYWSAWVYRKKHHDSGDGRFEP